MARYIDADKMIERIRPPQKEDDSSCILLSDARRILHDFVDEAPTADVVEVPCRCEKCKYRITHTCAITGIETLFCNYGEKPVAVEPTHFCGFGERRTDDDL